MYAVVSVVSLTDVTFWLPGLEKVMFGLFEDATQERTSRLIKGISTEVKSVTRKNRNVNISVLRKKVNFSAQYYL